jgi:hypothetical protein
MCRPDRGDFVLIKRATDLKALKGSTDVKSGTFISVGDRTKVLVEDEDPLVKDNYIVLAEVEHDGRPATVRASVNRLQIQAP